MTINVYKMVREGIFREVFQTGSRYICTPPVMDTDNDYMCLVSDLEATHRILTERGCDLGGSMSPVTTSTDITENPSDIFDADFSDFYSYRNGEVNIIITDNEVFYDKFRFATELAQRLNLRKKEDRITLFDAVVRNQIAGYYREPRYDLDSNGPIATFNYFAGIQEVQYTPSIVDLIGQYNNGGQINTAAPVPDEEPF